MEGDNINMIPTVRNVLHRFPRSEMPSTMVTQVDKHVILTNLMRDNDHTPFNPILKMALPLHELAK